MLTLPNLKQRTETLALESPWSTLKEFLKTVVIGATACGIESRGFGYNIQ
jgi:hypothetical protein